MNEVEFARFIKHGLGSPADSRTLAARIASEIRPRTYPNRGGQADARSFGRLRRRPRVMVAALTLAMIGTLNLGAAYFFPSYGEALANVPVVGAVSRSILSGTGLLNADVSAFNEVSSSNGHTLRLVGAYADGLQTIFFVEIDGQSLAMAGPPRKSDRYLVASDATLTDQFGHSYVRGGTPSGDQRPVIFGPLFGPAAHYGARVTLQVRLLTNVGTTQAIDGAWTLHATLFVHPAHVIPLPAPVTIAGNTYTITSLQSGAVLQLRWNVTGPNVGRVWTDWRALPEPVRAGQDPFWPRLFGPGVGAESGGYGINGGMTEVSGDITALVLSPGQYKVEFGSPVIGLASRTIVVPKQ
jgi:hypothetical protein